MKIGKIVKVVTLPDAIPAQLPKAKRILAIQWPKRKSPIRVTEPANK